MTQQLKLSRQRIAEIRGNYESSLNTVMEYNKRFGEVAKAKKGKGSGVLDIALSGPRLSAVVEELQQQTLSLLGQPTIKRPSVDFSADALKAMSEEARKPIMDELKRRKALQEGYRALVAMGCPVTSLPTVHIGKQAKLGEPLPANCADSLLASFDSIVATIDVEDEEVAEVETKKGNKSNKK